MNFLAKLVTPFRAIWKFLNSEKTKKALQAIDGMLDKALPIVKTIAALTPTRSDDEIIRLFEHFGIRDKIKAWLDLPVEQRGKALLFIGEQELRKEFPEAPMNQLSSAVNLAVSLMKTT